MHSATDKEPKICGVKNSESGWHDESHGVISRSQDNAPKDTLKRKGRGSSEQSRVAAPYHLSVLFRDDGGSTANLPTLPRSWNNSDWLLAGHIKRE
jgi:hypothetical protein